MANGVGSWDPPLENVLGIVGVHAVVLYTGKVLYWCFDQRLWGKSTRAPMHFKLTFPTRTWVHIKFGIPSRRRQVK